jgi:uncharacterized membrane protein
MLVGHLALVDAAAFTGAAFYVNFAEQPARLALDARALLEAWKLAYKRGFVMQASLAVVGFVLGCWAFYPTPDWRWLVGAGVLVANWPYTLLFVLPTNDILTAIPVAEANERSTKLIRKWGALHAVRTLLGAAATAIFVWALN